VLTAAVGDISPQDGSIAVSGLQPEHGYVIRVLAVNSSNFMAASDQISVQTKSASSDDYFSPLIDGEHISGEDSIGPVVKPYKALFDTPSHTPTLVQRENSNPSQQKRQVPSRRQTQSGPPTEAASKPETESDETIRQLTEKLDKLREEKENLDSQIQSEEEKYRLDHDNLAQQLQLVSQQLSDKNSVSRELGRQVAVLQTEESTARKNKMAAEKRLSQAQQEREKMKEDMKRWESEIDRIEDDIARLAKEQKEYEEKAEQEVKNIRAKIAAESAVNKNMEEGLRQTVAQIRDLEEEKKKIDEARQEHDQNRQPTLSGETDPHTRLMELQSTYAYYSYQLAQIKAANLNAQQQLDYWKSLFFANSSQMYPPVPLEVASPRRNSARRRAPSLGSVRGSHFGPYDVSSAPSFGQSLRTGSPSLGSTSQLFGLLSGAGNTANLLSMSPIDVDNLTGGAPTSPSAVDSLLPSGLLGDDTESRFGDAERARSHSIHDSPQINMALPGLGAPEALEQMNQGPSSPASLTSRSPSVFTSPRESSTHLPYLQGTNSFGDTDRRSIRSAAGSTRTGSGGGTKFSNLFGLGKQKGKTATEDAPTLGSLRPSESQSFPRQDLLEQSEPAPPSPRRRGSHSGLGFVGQMLGRASTKTSLDQPPAAKRRLNVFGMGKNDPWAERSDSPRPASTASAESYGLPRPSAETQSRFGWPVSSGESSTLRSSPLASDWGLAPPSSWGSRLHSRNSSSQYPLGLDGTEEEVEPSQTQAPIGTRPHSAHVSTGQATAPKLNPAAPSFKAIFSRSSTDKKSDKPSKGKKDKASKPTERESLDVEEEVPRISRDAMSVSTVDYSTDDTSALRESMDLASSSATPSEAGAPSSASQPPAKESLMQKLSRKSSAGFTTLAGRKGRNKRDEAVAAAEASAQDDELGRSVTSSLGPEDRDTPSPGLAAAARGFKFRSLRRRKADKTAEGDAEDEEQEIEEVKDKEKGKDKEK
jgi:hypothetical protein